MSKNLMETHLVKEFNEAIDEKVRLNTRKCMRQAGTTPGPDARKRMKKQRKQKQSGDPSQDSGEKPENDVEGEGEGKETKKQQSIQNCLVIRPCKKARDCDSKPLLATKNDPVLRELVMQHKCLCEHESGTHRWHHDVAGMNRKSLSELWTAHHVEDSETGKLVMDDSPPLRVKGNSIIEHSAPGKHFVTFSLDSIHVLKTFLISCEPRRIAPMRWMWDCVLSKDLDALETDDCEFKNLAFLVCLIPSAATTDKKATESTVNLHGTG
jgi:hypothetical protein